MIQNGWITGAGGVYRLRDDLRPTQGLQVLASHFQNYRTTGFFKVGLKDDAVGLHIYIPRLARPRPAGFCQRLGFHESTMIFLGSALCARITGQ